MDKLAEKMAELADKFGPQVVDAARGAAVTEGYSCLVGHAFASLIALAGLYLAYRMRKWANTFTGEEKNFKIFLALMVAIVSTIVCLTGVWGVIDPWLWTTINHPDLWIAKQVLHL